LNATYYRTLYIHRLQQLISPENKIVFTRHHSLCAWKIKSDLRPTTLIHILEIYKLKKKSKEYFYYCGLRLVLKSDITSYFGNLKAQKQLKL